MASKDVDVVEEATVEDVKIEESVNKEEQEMAKTVKDSGLGNNGTLILVNKLREDQIIGYYDEEILIPPQGQVEVETAGIKVDSLPNTVIVVNN